MIKLTLFDAVENLMTLSSVQFNNATCLKISVKKKVVSIKFRVMFLTMCVLCINWVCVTYN